MEFNRLNPKSYRQPEREVMASVGPTLEKKEQFVESIRKGCKWFRLPLGYRERNHLNDAKNIRAAEAEVGCIVNIVADLPSARPRFNKIEDVPIKQGTRIYIKDICNDNSDKAALCVSYLDEIVEDVVENERVLFLDGRIVCRITKIEDRIIELFVESGTGTIKTGNSLVFPDSNLSYRMITDKDLELLADLERSGIKVDWVLLSMVGDADEVIKSREILSKSMKNVSKIMSKIETANAVENLTSITVESDGMMVARGDLGQSVSYASIPIIEKDMVRIARICGKIIFVATQALEIFANTKTPQRAELIDLATVAWLGADGIMLGKETVYSKYALESISLAHDVINNVSYLKTGWLYNCKATRSNAIAIEGPDGVGKTTLCKRLERHGYIVTRGLPAEWEVAPMKSRMIESSCWLSSAMYFLSGVIEKNGQILQNESEMVIYDRSVWSSIVVHYKRNANLLPELCNLLELVAPYIDFPKHVIVLDAGYDNTIFRISKKDVETMNMDLALKPCEESYIMEMDFFLWLKDIGLDITFIDASDDSETVESRVLKLIKKWKR